MATNRYTIGGRPPSMTNSILSTLRATEMVDSKPILPAEIMATILDYLPVSDLLRVARTSRRMCEMVYDDTRWVTRLQSMGLWDEGEARRKQRQDSSASRARSGTSDGANAATAAAVTGTLSPPVNTIGPGVRGSLLFDATSPVLSLKSNAQVQQPPSPSLGSALVNVTDGRMAAAIDLGGDSSAGANQRRTPVVATDPYKDPNALLQVLKGARSLRGRARQEYGKIYGALAPFYFDLVRARRHVDPIVFKVFRDPERQARMLANLHTFARSDWASGWQQRDEKLANMTTIFESAVLREFEHGYELLDIDGRMRRYAHVLHALNSGHAVVDLFIHKNPVFSSPDVLGDPIERIDWSVAAQGKGGDSMVSLEPARRFLATLRQKINEQADVMQRVFPEPGSVFRAFMEKVREEIMIDYVTPLFEAAHDHSIPAYLKAVAGFFEQTLEFLSTLRPPEGARGEDYEEEAKALALRLFESHLDLYLQEELDYFTEQAESEVASWEQKLSEQDASTESFYMSNLHRQTDKKNFLTSFKKVVMMPVTVLPSSLGLSASKSSQTKPAADKPGSTANPVPPVVSQPPTPGLPPDGQLTTVRPDPFRPPGLPEKAPTDELEAQAALMASRLEGIKSLLSIEVALHLVHEAKASLGRTSLFVRLGGQAGDEAREQCSAIFVVLLRILGTRHVKSGFDKALGHLSHYNPRDVSDHQRGVVPLLMFVELVNVGDLISQMIDVFYEQQLAGPKLADRNDFLDPAGMSKKKWEQMLDESVAAGLNKGIDVLMDEVAYICATMQVPTDYNPQSQADPSSLPAVAASSSSSNNLPTTTSSKHASSTITPAISDLGPTLTARHIVDLVSSHTSALVGTTEKAILDVFNAEVGQRLFTAICKHLKRQRVSTSGAVKLIADTTLYFDYVTCLRNPHILPYFRALRELSQIYLIEARHASDLARIIADADRFGGVFRPEEVYEFAERRADWYQVKREVERVMYGLECGVM